MKRKIVLLLVSCLMAVSLVLASCAPAVVEEEEKAPVVEEKKPVVEEKKPVVPEKEMVKDSLGRLVEKPQYGGILTYVFYKPQMGWDSCYANPSSMYRHNLVTEPLVVGDWTKGPAGTGDVMWQPAGWIPPEKYRKGCLAESWEWKDPTTIVFHLRKGVHWQNKPPVNGREFTADDVVYNLERYYTVPTSYLLTGSPQGHVPTSIKALDKYTVEVKLPDPATARVMYDEMSISKANILPPEVIEKYGDFRDWHNVVGTGPFIVTDEVAGTSTTLVRNPNFWEEDPLHPDLHLQLPYVDQVNWVIIMDVSTQLASLRTGKADLLRGSSWENGEAILLQRPDMQYYPYVYTATYVINMRLDKDFPWNDKRVRHALALAINNPEMKEEFYGGHASILAATVLPIGATSDWYVPLENLPKETQELYEYHPDKARQLLAEAGYPDGFKCSVITRSMHVDILAMIKAYWADIGVELELDVKESGVYYSIAGSRSHPEMFFIWGATYDIPGLANLFDSRLGGRANLSRVVDPKIDEFADKLREAYSLGDYDEQVRLAKEIQPYIIDQQWAIQPPDFHYYNLWQPWVHRMYGEYAIGGCKYYYNYRYLWIDEDLKKEMGY